MAKITGTQDIPSVLLNLYRGTLTEKQPDGNSRKRYPYRVPPMQATGANTSAKQRAQRERFKTAMSDFRATPYAERQRWYAARPEWSSLLWYYNYFIMSDLSGNANQQQGGVGVIKSIQIVKDEVPVSGTKSFVIDAVDPAKTVVMMFGNSFISDLIQHHDGVNHDNTEITVNLSPNIDPSIAEVILTGQAGYQETSEGSGSGIWGSWYVTEVNAATIKIKLQNLSSGAQFGWSMDIIEHKAQTIYPVLVSIAAEAVVVDWAKQPTVVADVSILVIEYI